jgi:hypothetical protein
MAYASTGYATTLIDVSSAGLLQQSSISWTANTPTGTNILVEASLNNATWYPCINDSPLPFSEGEWLYDKNLYVKVNLATNEALSTPEVYILTISINNSPPIILLVDFTKAKISDETGMTVSTVTFQSSLPLAEWEARADGLGRGQGYLVGNGGASEANTGIAFDVDYTELPADKKYRINVYGKSVSGVWNDYES